MPCSYVPAPELALVPEPALALVQRAVEETLQYSALQQEVAIVDPVLETYLLSSAC